MKERILHIETIKRVVVRGANWVGDAVMTVPALRELRRVLPDAHVTLATRAWAEDIFAGADFLDEMLVIDAQARGVRGMLRQAREWRARSFDLALLLPNAFEPALVASAARVPVRIGYATDGRRALLTHALPVPIWRGERHEVFYYLNLVSELARRLDQQPALETVQPRFELTVSEARRHEAREFLRGRGISLTRPFVALCPGSTNSRAKRWPSERFAAVGDLLIDEMDAQVALIGARDERAVSDEVAGLMRRRPVVLTGEMELAESVAVLSVADLLVTNDTGPAHIAAALSRPVVVIFGPTNPLTTRPFSPHAVVVREPPECAPCMLRDCPIDHRCMTAITPAAVFARAAEVLAQREVAEVATR